MSATVMRMGPMARTEILGCAISAARTSDVSSAGTNNTVTRPIATRIVGRDFESCFIALTACADKFSRFLRAKPIAQMIGHAKSVGHNGQCRIYCCAGRKEAAVHNVKIVHIMRLAVHIERGGFWIVAKADRAVLVSDSSQRNAVAEEKIASEETFVAI